MLSIAPQCLHVPRMRLANRLTSRYPINPWVVEVLRLGSVIPLHSVPSLSGSPITLDSYSPQSVKGRALEEEISRSMSQRCGRACVSFSRVLQSHVCGHQGVRRVETHRRPLHSEPRFVFAWRLPSRFSARCGGTTGWSPSIWRTFTLRSLFTHRSCKYLRFTTGGRAWQFKVLCFSLSTAPQVFTRVMAPVSGFLHQPGVWMLQYLDDWLILASSRKEACWARVKVLSLCQDLGIVVNLDKSSLAPSQSGDQDRAADFPGFADSLEDRKVLLNSRIISVFKGAGLQSSGGFCYRLRMRALQLALKRSWDFRDDSALIPWNSPSREDVLRWCAESRLEEGV